MELAEPKVMDGGVITATVPGSPTGLTILMSTFNGARYLPAQLHSFVNQSYRGWRLVWRDDGSDDDTALLMDRFAAARGPGTVVRSNDSGVHLGIFDSFLTLLDQARDAEAVALADQDDVWLPEKLQRAIDALAAMDPARPALYCTGLTVVDEDLRPVGGPQRLSPVLGFPGALLQNIASGCTIVMNQAAVRTVLAAVRPYHAVHDWWIYLLITAVGGQIVFENEPSMLYRQHGANAIGASWARSIPRRVISAIKRGAGPYNSLLQQHLDALRRNEAMLTPDIAARVRRVSAAFGGAWWQRIGLLRLDGFRRETPAQTALLALWLLRGTSPLLRRFRHVRMRET